METADSLRKLFDCRDDNDLGRLFNRSGGAVSVWRKKGLPPAIEKRAYELMAEKGLTSESASTYSIKTSHRALTPEEENLLKLLDAMPEIKDSVRAMALLPERKRKIQLGEMLKELDKIEGKE